jgi:hypothetical protein
MSGSGSWQNLLPDSGSRQWYSESYPSGGILPENNDSQGLLIKEWEKADIVRIENGKSVPLGPIMTDEDLYLLKQWFQGISGFMADAVENKLKEYRQLAWKSAGGPVSEPARIENLLTIMTCALTLDSMVFSSLRKEVVGTYPLRGKAGHFFFWGYAFEEGPQRIFGFTTYNGLEGRQLHVIRSHGLDRTALKSALRIPETWDFLNELLWLSETGEAPFLSGGSLQPDREKGLEKGLLDAGLIGRVNPATLAVPVFDSREKASINALCRKVSEQIMVHLRGALNELESLLPYCSFAGCSRADVFCMLFHLAYSYAADLLVARRMIPDFPQKAGGEWGVWIA